jgi:hypothetical protein
MIRYRVKYGFNAKDLYMSTNTGGDVRKLFFTDDFVFGRPSDEAGFIVIDNRYLIPAENLEEVDSVAQVMNSEAYRDIISQGQGELGINEGQSENLAQTLTGKSGAYHRDMLNSYRKGAIIGLITGAALGMYFHKKVWLWALGGMIAGGYVSSKVKNIQLKTQAPK